MIMFNNCADITNKEVPVICFRWVDKNLQVHEDFVGLHPVSDTKADTKVKISFDNIQKMGLKIENARGKCYDETSTLEVVKNGVAAKIKLIIEHAILSHYYGHALT